MLARGSLCALVRADTMTRRMSAVSAPNCFFLDAREHEIVTLALERVAAEDLEQASVLGADFDRLGRAADLVRRCPSIAARRRSRPHGHGPGEALVDALCRVRDYDLDLHVPTKAIFGQAYLVAKINFFKALGYSLEPLDGAEALYERVQAELGQSIYSKLAEELFLSIVTDANGARVVKISAAEELFRIWEDRLLAEIDDFAPLLESIWEARNKVRPVLGAMLGVHELHALFREAKDDRFLDYFGGDDVPVEQLQAFEEFLFGLAHEEIARLREHLRERARDVVSFDEARGLLGPRPESWAPPDGGPQALYTSYKRRRVKALYRALTGAGGPKKTAEEYVMIELLRRGTAA